MIPLLGALLLQGLPQAPDGWRVEVVAQAPALRHPSVVACAPDGRVFVAEDPMDIRAPADQPLGRILCAHPDGRLTVFAEQLHAVFGMQHLDGHLYVLHNPRYTRFRDGGDAGTERVDLIRSTNPKPWALDWNDHVPANFKLGMDGYFYIAVGDKGVFGAVGTDGTTAELRGGGILRMHPDARELEVWCRGTRNILDVALDAEDEIFTYDNTDEHQWMGRFTHMVEGGLYGYPWDFQPRRPYTLWMAADFGAGAATAALAYLEAALPAPWPGSLLLADFGKQSIVRVRVEREGATFKVAARDDFLRDRFRPVGLCVSPDGLSFYVTDWAHEGEKNPKAVAGRLLRVRWTGPTNAVPVPAKDIDALRHPARSVRLAAQRRLSNAAAEPELRALLADAGAPVLARVHALWALETVGLEALKDPDPVLRRQAARRLSTRKDPRLPEALLRDPDAGVRFRVAVGLGRIGQAAAVPALRAALADPDAWVRHAAHTALHRIGDWTAVAEGLSSPDPLIRQGTLFALRDTHHDAAVAALARAPDPVRADALRQLAFVARKDPPWKGEWWDSPYHPALTPRPPRTETWSGTEAVLAALREGVGHARPDVRQAAVEGLVEAREAAAAPLLRGRFAAEKDPAVRVALLRALAAFRDVAARRLFADALATEPAEALDGAAAIGADDLLQAVLAGPYPTELRAKAALALGRAGPLEPLLRALEEADPVLRRAVLEALGRRGDRKALPALLAAFRQEDTRDAAADALAALPAVEAVDAYIHGLGRGPALRDRSRQALATLGLPALGAVEARLRAGPVAPAVAAELQAVFKKAPRTSPLFRLEAARPDPAVYLEQAMKTPGDAEKGRAIFERSAAAACASCHKVRGAGGELGPDLSLIGAQYPRRELAESVLYPSRRLREGYAQVVVRTKSGDVVTGLPRGETADELILIGADTRPRTIRKGEIERRRTSELSFMPDGLHQSLSLEDFADLLAWLESLK